MLGFKKEDKVAALGSICMVQFYRKCMVHFLSSVLSEMLLRGPRFTSETLGSALEFAGLRKNVPTEVYRQSC